MSTKEVGAQVSMAFCSLVVHGGPGVLHTIVSYGAVEAIVEGARKNFLVSKAQLASAVTLKQFAAMPWEIAHQRIAKSGGIRLVPTPCPRLLIFVAHTHTHTHTNT